VIKDLISVLVPSRNRPYKIESLVESINSTATYFDLLEIILYIDNDDKESQYKVKELEAKYGNKIRYIIGERILLSEMWNRCYTESNGEILMHCGDDIVFRTNNWDALIREEYAKSHDKILLVYGRDGICNKKLSTHSFLHRNWVETLGYFVPPYFSSDWNDVWLMELGNRINRCVYLENIYTEHMHYVVEKSKYDITYKEREIRGARDGAWELYQQKKGQREKDALKLLKFIKDYKEKQTFGIHYSHKQFNVVKSKNIDYWINLEKNWMGSEIFQVFDSLITNETTYIEIGAWIGPFILYAGKLAKKSFGFEADPVAYQELKNNIDYNQPKRKIYNVYNKAISFTAGIIKIGNTHDESNSQSSMLFSDHHHINWEVESITLDHFFINNNMSGHIVIKMDIKGDEYKLIPNIKNIFSENNIDLLLSLYPTYLWRILSAKYGENIISKIKIRVILVYKHTNLLFSLPYRYLFSINRKKINILNEFINGIFWGKFEKYIVATNREYNPIDNEDVS